MQSINLITTNTPSQIERELLDLSSSTYEKSFDSGPDKMLDETTVSYNEAPHIVLYGLKTT